jgi:hypothetical protein
MEQIADCFGVQIMRECVAAGPSTKEVLMRQAKGITIVQLMVVLLIVGIVGLFVVEFIIDKRCEADPSKQLCVDRKAAKSN